MNKSSARYCVRLYESIRASHGQEAADEICGKGVASSAPPEAKGKWAAETMAKLEGRFDEAGRAQTLAGCACGPGPSQLEAARRMYLKCKSLEEYAERRNEEMQGGARFEARDGLLYVSYPRCYCSMVKNSGMTLPRTWCLCSCEYTRRACAAAFSSPVEVKLLKSVIAGDNECLFEIKMLN